MGTDMMMLTSYNDVMGILMLEQNQILHSTPLTTFTTCTTTDKGANISC